MKIAVCAKYVPVVSRIQFDYEQKTIIREGVPSEVNPFDLLALVCGVELKSDDRDEVLVLTMGPPQAREGAGRVPGPGSRPGPVADRPGLGRVRHFSHGPGHWP